MAWTVEFIPEAAQQLRKLDRTAAGRIARYLQETVSNGRDPRQRGQGLTANLAGLWRYRVGDYRVICQIETSRLLVLVVRVSHRGEAYR
ncbi:MULTISPECIES: type II toxin-antitoxin system RelE family toxin [Synechococcales]|uniref:type II toxin-antitoxin system RelE family toxin n=1 Tax=unclassified Synechococcus TaxID=2626047 RepID=UPI000DB2F799|nr:MULTISPECIES: type II toxin-antitoxin system RelE/ParE family toxin [unclassified Synechococcus]PZU97833.1 MAG: type II toxin-antitoxin system mRNA interferase toxin, RelE/StbE family [Cyanobium sp.]PZV03187.1 MAG: type II toxin-antitoxin system mRNA interferase toxin, RelE/StbE family [Cyanobium sp.]